MIYIDVDTAVTVPVNIMSLMDDTDFITREVAIAYNQAGMDLVWNFVTSAGVTTQTAVTPTTAGVYDWTHVGDGMYKMEIPASGGGSINNDTKGVGYFTGICTGVLAWRGPDIVFRAAALNDAMIDGGDSLDVNVTAVSGDTTAADNLELQYDGTGLTGGTFPSTQDEVGGIGTTGGAALPVEATSDNASGAIIDSVTILGTEAGTYANTEADDAAYHVITGTATALDWVYGFVLGGGYVASALEWKGFVNSNNDSITVQAWNGSTWDTRKVIQGVPGSTDQLETIELLAKHTTTAGLVYLRFVTSGDTTPELHTNVLSVLKVNTSRTVGYNQGISVDTLTGIAGTEAWYNGTGDNPSLTWADAQTIAASVGLTHYHVANGSTIVLDQATDNVEIKGDEFTVDFNGQSINNSSVSHGLVYTGTFSGYPHLLHAGINAITGPGAKIGWGAIRGPIVSTDGGTSNRWVLHDCWGVDETTGEFDFGAAVATAQVVYITAYDGPLKISNINTAGDKLYLSGNGSLVIDASCTNGTIYISGQWKLTNSGSSTIVYDDITTDTDAVLADTGELQTEWANGGRLDLLLDAIPTTAMRGTDFAATAASIAVLNNISVADILAGVCDTGITVAKAGEMLAALAAGKVTATSDGTYTTLTYKKRDGTTTSFTVIVTEADTTRATTGALA